MADTGSSASIKKHGVNDIAGAILGHGLTLDDSLVVIPEGIELRPLSQLGCDLALGRGAPIFDDEQMDILSTAYMRSMSWDLEDEGMAHIYKPGDVIYNMGIHFRFTWDEDTAEKATRYYSTGIVTGKKLFENIQTVDTDDPSRVLTSAEINRATSHHDTNITPVIWDRRMTLGEILKYLYEHRIRRIEERVAARVATEGTDKEPIIRGEENEEVDRYYVISCRGLGGRAGEIERIECFPDRDEEVSERPRAPRRQMSRDEIFKSFVDDIRFLGEVIRGLVRTDRDLLETYERVVAGLEVNNAMTKEEFCQIKRYVELFRRDLPTTRDIRRRIQYSANRARLCNIIEILKILKEYRYNLTPELHELIRLNTPKKLTGELNTVWTQHFESVIDDASYDRKIKIILAGIDNYTRAIGDEYVCPNAHDVVLEGGYYYQMYLENRETYLNLR
jgi:hypothetical protein